MGFCTNPNRMRDWDMNEWIINPFTAQENPLKTSLENIKRSEFSLQSKTPKLGKDIRKWRIHGVVATLSTFSTVST